MFILWVIQRELANPNLTLIDIERRNLSVELDEDEIQFLAAEMFNEERNSSSVKTKTTLRHLAGVRRYLAALGIANPLANYKPPVAAIGEAHPIEGGESTIDAMIEKADHHVSKCVMLALVGYMGFRISEARSVRPEHVIIPTRELLVRGKGDSWDKVPIPRKALKWLFMGRENAIVENRDFLIDGADRTVRQWYTDLAEEALGRPIAKNGEEGSHSARHSVGTDVYNDTKDLLLTGKVLRQRDPRSTVTYVGIDREKLRNALENRRKRTDET